MYAVGSRQTIPVHLPVHSEFPCGLPHPNLGVSIDHHWYPSPRITPSLMYTMARHQPLAGKSSCQDD